MQCYAFPVAHINSPSEEFNSSIHMQKSHVVQCISCCTSKFTIAGIQFQYRRAKEPCSTMRLMLHLQINQQRRSIPVYICKKAMQYNTFHVAPLDQPAQSISHSSIRSIQFQYTRAKKPCSTMRFMLHLQINQQRRSIPVYTCKKAMQYNAFHVTPLYQPACSISHSSNRCL